MTCIIIHNMYKSLTQYFARNKIISIKCDLHLKTQYNLLMIEIYRVNACIYPFILKLINIFEYCVVDAMRANNHYFAREFQFELH